MGINRSSILCRLSVVLTIVVASFMSSCVRDDSDSIENGGKCEYYPEGTNTYFNFMLRFSSNDTRGTLPDGDTAGSVAENAVKNVYVVMFDNKDTFETGAYFSASDLVAENGSGNLGASATEGYTYQKAIPVTAGEKTVFAIVNVNNTTLSALQTFLVKGSTTVSQLNDYKLNLLPSGASYPARLDLPKYGNYVAPTPSGYLSVTRLGVSYDESSMTPSTSNGMMMSGYNTVKLVAGVTQTEATHGVKNLVTIYTDRLAAKVSLKLAMTSTVSSSLISSPLYDVANNSSIKIIENATYSGISSRSLWWVSNIPSQMYLMEHQSGSRHPYYYEYSDFSMWQNRLSDSRKAWFENTTEDRNYYTPENIVYKPVRGNASFISIKAKLVPYTNNGSAWIPLSTTSKQGIPLTNYHLALSYRGLWILNKVDGSHQYALATNSQTKWEGLRSNFSATFNPVYLIQMTTNSHDKIDQDAAALAKSGGTAIAAGYYMFCYSAKDLHTGEWFDRMDVWYYNGNMDAGGWQRGEEIKYTMAFYDGFFCYYRINLEDYNKAIYDPERYAVHRNDWFDVKITNIKEVGYPDEEDLAAYPDDELSSSWLEVQISVQDWRNGGEQSETIGK